jgi:elongation factor P
MSDNLNLNVKILYKKEPYIIVAKQFIKIGRGGSFNKLKLKHLISGNIIEVVINNKDLITSANIIEIKLQYLYYLNNIWYFCNVKNFEQYAVDKNIIHNDIKNWLYEEYEYNFLLWNNIPIKIELSGKITLKVVETDINLKNNTINSNNKPAILENGEKIQVPMFINNNDYIIVDMKTFSYFSRDRK